MAIDTGKARFEIIIDDSQRRPSVVLVIHDANRKAYYLSGNQARELGGALVQGSNKLVTTQLGNGRTVSGPI
jgi:hypothetical protein